MRFVGETKLNPGERFPAERELMMALAVGRSTVREAVCRLQALGVVEVRKGSGTYLLRPVNAHAVHLPLTINTEALRDRLLQTLEVRRCLELEACAIAATRATAADIVAIEGKLIAMERVFLKAGTAGREDLAFHLAIFDATGNPLFRQLLEGIREAWEGFFDQPFDRPHFARRSYPFHRELFDAIRGHDAERARERMAAILAIVEEDIRDMAQ